VVTSCENGFEPLLRSHSLRNDVKHIVRAGRRSDRSMRTRVRVRRRDRCGCVEAFRRRVRHEASPLHVRRVIGSALQGSSHGAIARDTLLTRHGTIAREAMTGVGSYCSG
jgi:hypothetical protein